jgi:ankyrin repeat protein
MEICQILCSFADVDRSPKDIDENTPLHLASKLGHIACVIYLVKDAGADL